MLRLSLTAVFFFAIAFTLASAMAPRLVADEPQSVSEPQVVSEPQSAPKEWLSLTEQFCLHCHDASTETRLDFESLAFDLSSSSNREHWIQVYDRVAAGEMPPAEEPQPDDDARITFLSELQQEILNQCLAEQAERGRVPARRLSKRELGYTLQDLLHLDLDVTADVPDEMDAGGFDTCGRNQRISPVHMESYLRAADLALDHAFQLGKNPYEMQELNFFHNPFLNDFHTKPLQDGGNISRRTQRGVALFRDVDYLLTSAIGGATIQVPGVYRIRSQVSSYQSTEPVTFKLIRKEPSGGTHVVQIKDLLPGRDYFIESESFFHPGDTFYTTFETDEEPFGKILAAGGVEKYDGPGIEVLAQRCEGPIHSTWPPESTLAWIGGAGIIEADEEEFRVTKPWLPKRMIKDVVSKFATKAFRRPASRTEIESLASLANQPLSDERDIVSALRVPLKAILSSPQFLTFASDPAEWDDYALASRLSYFLWSSLPDDELSQAASDGRLSDANVLRAHVDRMLKDPKFERFVRDFLGQWLRLNQINLTNPDSGLYPEYDEVLDQSLRAETEHFFQHLIEENLPASNLIDSDFTFVNRRLAEHYGLADVPGQTFRKVRLPADSVRGGLLTQAAVLKTTANGTTTSPVARGNFVLTNFLGMPPSPPPPNVGSIEPDTRGKTTIREILEAHRSDASCNQCHRNIDPPGFALECFDPIGGFRTHYRATGKPGGVFSLFSTATYHRGPEVNASGRLADGNEFENVQEFKQLLLDRKEVLVRNLVSQLVEYATGGPVEFSDRSAIDAIINQTRENEFRVRDLLHAVVQSRLFREL